MKIADLFARIGIKVDSDKLDNFKKQLGNVGKLMGVTALSAAGVAAGLQKIARDSMDAAAGMKQFEAETGVSTTELQKWQSVANETNNSAEAVTSSIKALAANREALRLGKGGNITTFQMLGVDPMEDPFQILEDLRTKTANLAPAMKKNLLAQAGISSELIQVLELSNEQFDTMANRAFIIPPSAINTLDKARAASQRMGNAFNYIKTMAGAALAPNIEKMSKAFAEFIQQNEGQIIKTIKTLAGWLQSVGKAISVVVTHLANLVNGTIGAKGAIMALATVFIALNSAVLLPVAGIVLLFALIEDFVRYSQGKSSVVGRLFENFPALEAVFNKMTQPLKDIMELIGAIFSGDTQKIQDIIDKWGIWGEVVQGLYDHLINIKNIISDLFEGKSLVGGLADLSGITNILPEGGKGQQFLDKLGENEYLRMLTNPLYALEKLSGVVTGGNNSTTNNVNINVNGAGSPEETGRQVHRLFQRSTDERAAGVVE